MKVIDLLVKIENGEDIPKKIKFDNQIFEYREEMLDYYCYDYDLNLMGYQKILNEEIEVIEEPKKIEKLHNELIDTNRYIGDKSINYFSADMKDVCNKINEIIDYINDKENK